MLESFIGLILIVAVIGAIAVAILYARGGLPGNVGSTFFKPRAEPRIEVVEYAALDSKRRLVLIRRDDVEHLLMTGGPVDVVIETNIGDTASADAKVARNQPPTEPVFQSNANVRSARRFGERPGAAPVPADRMQPVSLGSLRRAQTPLEPDATAEEFAPSDIPEPPALR